MAWTFLDPVTSATAVMNIAPNDGGSPYYQKNLTILNTTAPDGVALVFEGRPSTLTGSFKGVAHTNAEYVQLYTWYQKRYPIYVTDDIGRQFAVTFTSFSTQRAPLFHHPYRFTYTVQYVIIDGSGDTL